MWKGRWRGGGEVGGGVNGVVGGGAVEGLWRGWTGVEGAGGGGAQYPFFAYNYII